MKFLKNLFKSSEQIEGSAPKQIAETPTEPETPKELPEEIQITWPQGGKEIYEIQKTIEKMSNDLKELIYSVEHRKVVVFNAMKELGEKRLEVIERLRNETGITDSEEEYIYIPPEGPDKFSKFIKKKKN